ncbi:MAG TPA: hypothetical protein VK209_08360, partial [Candidatus Sulfotelmatobacter sp.]|nr:hypothetical protein [Candidatus Sulfotelmatobacter sp.]
WTKTLAFFNFFFYKLKITYVGFGFLMFVGPFKIDIYKDSKQDKENTAINSLYLPIFFLIGTTLIFATRQTTVKD